MKQTHGKRHNTIKKTQKTTLFALPLFKFVILGIIVADSVKIKIDNSGA
jgi:hypothetical protein